MRYFTNLEIAKRYGTSSNTIGYWIEDAVNGKNELQVAHIKQKTSDKMVYKIISNSQNIIELQRLVERGKNRQSLVNYQTVSINKNTIKIFNEEIISDILNSLSEGFIPLKYSYTNQGAEIWNRFVNEGYSNSSYPTTKQTEQLLRILLKNMSQLNPQNKKINVFDLGCGNFLPISKFVNNLEMDGLLNKYIGVDISNEMLAIAKENALKCIPENKVILELRDFESSNLLYHSSFYKEDNTINLFLFLGGTFENYSDNSIILKHLRDSMMVNDLLVLDLRTDNENTLDIFNSISEKNERLFMIPSVFGINPDDCVLSTWYNEDRKCKYLGFELKKDYNITYTYESGATKNIYINSGRKIILVFYKILIIEDFIKKQLDLGLKLKQFITTDTGETGLIVSTKKTLSERL